MRSESEIILDRCKEISNLRISTMRQTARDHFTFYDAKNFLIGINGSYARREATARSDIDLFFITLDGDVCGAKRHQKDFFEILRKQNFILPSDGGVFDRPLDAKEILKIGGNEDTNINITRRILLLLEGEWIFNEEEFYDIRSKILATYVKEDITDDRICMYLLNDIIRYWRTVCVDFEHKVAEGKSKNIRLIKLRFSRMMLYVSGILAVSATWKLPAIQKLETLECLFKLTPIERFRRVSSNKIRKYWNCIQSFSKHSMMMKFELA